MSDPSEGESICVGCGLCCGGWLFDQVDLAETDDTGLFTAKGVTLFETSRGQAFAQPCTQFVDGCCAVYADRPAMCRNYRCKLLRRHESGEVTYAQARALIDAIHAFDVPNTVRPQLAAISTAGGRSLSELLANAHRAIDSAQDPAALRKRHSAELIRAMGIIAMLERDFLDK